MTDHLPECLNDDDTYGWRRWCICDELRACEQRIRLADDDYAYVAGQAEADGRRRGWNEALDAAREAVKGVNWFNDEGKMLNAIVATADALAAIDALREKP